MRKIKFRAWNKVLKTMHNVQGIKLVEPKKGWVMIEGYDIDGDDIEFMQFTGLLDKNGKEIYEGDIITVENIHPRCFKKTVIVDKYKVEWLDCDGVYFVSDPPYNHYVALGDSEEFGEIEVIGNIHENPELLK